MALTIGGIEIPTSPNAQLPWQSPLACQISLDPSAPRLNCSATGATLASTAAPAGDDTPRIAGLTPNQILSAAVGVTSLIVGAITITNWLGRREEKAAADKAAARLRARR
jgi:hypothetical protein